MVEQDTEAAIGAPESPVEVDPPVDVEPSVASDELAAA